MKLRDAEIPEHEFLKIRDHASSLASLEFCKVRYILVPQLLLQDAGNIARGRILEGYISIHIHAYPYTSIHIHTLSEISCDILRSGISSSNIAIVSF